MLGLLTTYIVGYFASLIISKISNEKPKQLDPNLFTPLLAKRLKKKEQANNPEVITFVFGAYKY